MKIFQLFVMFSALFFYVSCGARGSDNTPLTTPHTCVPLDAVQSEARVLFIGNSLSIDIAENLKILLESAGYSTDIAQSIPGGYRLSIHDSDPITTQLISQGYDVVVLQEHSEGPLYWNDEPYPNIASLQTKINANGGTMVFFQTWGYKDDLSSTDDLIQSYETVGAFFTAPVIAVGRAWKEFLLIHANSQSFSLFSDSQHANKYGKALSTYVFYVYLTKRSPVGLPTLSLSAEVATLLQNIAWDTYQSYGNCL